MLTPYDPDEPLSMFPVVFASFVGALAVAGLFFVGDDPQPVAASTPKASIAVVGPRGAVVRQKSARALADQHTIGELLERLEAMESDVAATRAEVAQALAVKHDRGKRADRRRILKGLKQIVAEAPPPTGEVTIDPLQQVTVGLDGKDALGPEAKALLAEVQKALQQIGEIEGANRP